MKILHTSDWHLGKKLDIFSRLDEQIEVLEEINQIANEHKVDAIIVAGDIFDTFNPPSEAVSLFYRATKKMTNGGTRPVIAIAGNHDSADRFESPDPLAKECGIFLAGKPDFLADKTSLETGIRVTQSDKGFIELLLPNANEPLRIITTAYANEQRLKTAFDIDNSEEELRLYLQNYWQSLADKYCDKNGVNILLAHLFMIKKGGLIPEEPEDEKPILHIGGVQDVHTSNIPDSIDYVALGHLHRMQQVDNLPCPVYYSGSPLAFSFSEANQQKFVLILDFEPGMSPQIEKIELKSGRPLLRLICKGIDDAIIQLKENPKALVEITIVSDEFLTGMDKKRLYEAHDGIVVIIPQISIANNDANTNTDSIDLTADISKHFVNYFKSQNSGQEPNSELLDLFKEIISEEN
jgi:exonuclease SbcD